MPIVTRDVSNVKRDCTLRASAPKRPNHAPTAPIPRGQTQVCGSFCCMRSPHSANKRDNATVVQVALLKEQVDLLSLVTRIQLSAAPSAQRPDCAIFLGKAIPLGDERIVLVADPNAAVRRAPYERLERQIEADEGARNHSTGFPRVGYRR